MYKIEFDKQIDKIQELRKQISEEDKENSRKILKQQLKHETETAYSLFKKDITAQAYKLIKNHIVNGLEIELSNTLKSALDDEHLKLAFKKIYVKQAPCSQSEKKMLNPQNMTKNLASTTLNVYNEHKMYDPNFESSLKNYVAAKKEAKYYRQGEFGKLEITIKGFCKKCKHEIKKRIFNNYNQEFLEKKVDILRKNITAFLGTTQTSNTEQVVKNTGRVPSVPQGKYSQFPPKYKQLYLQ